MKIYIAGPISKYLNQGANKTAFLDAAEAIQEQGHDAVIPHDLIEHLDLHPIDDYEQIMDICLESLRQCDAVAMLPNWRDSKGANIEYNYANRHKIPAKEVLMWVQEFRKQKQVA